VNDTTICYSNVNLTQKNLHFFKFFCPVFFFFCPNSGTHPKIISDYIIRLILLDYVCDFAYVSKLGNRSFFVFLSAATAQVSIEVLDRNDHAPELVQSSYTVTVRELMPVGSPVVTLEATDRDIGANALLTYTVVSGADSQYFYADSIFASGAGVIRIKEVISVSRAATLTSYNGQSNQDSGRINKCGGPVRKKLWGLLTGSK